LVHREPARENPTVSEIAAGFPRRQETKRDRGKDERRNIDRRKRATPQFCKKDFTIFGSFFDHRARFLSKRL